MKKKLFLIPILLLSLSYSSYAHKIFEEITLAKSTAPYLLKITMDHLRLEKLSTTEAQEAITNLKELNENTNGTQLIDQHFFIVSGIYKSALNYKFKVSSSTDTLSSLQVKSLNEKLANNKLIYTPFAQFIIKSVYYDFEEYLKDNYFDNFQALKNSDNKSFLKANQLRKLLKYSGQWVNTILSSSPTQFNQICTQVILAFLQQSNIQSRLFFLHSPALKEDMSLFKGLDTAKVQSFMNKKEEGFEYKDPNAEILIEKSASPNLDMLKIDPIEKATEEIDRLFEKGEF